MYANGVTTSKNYEKAYYWFLKAAEQNDVDAQLNIGNMYESGIGVEVNKEKSIYWYKKAAENGSVEAQEKIKELQSNI